MDISDPFPIGIVIGEVETLIGIPIEGDEFYWVIVANLQVVRAVSTLPSTVPPPSPGPRTEGLKFPPTLLPDHYNTSLRHRAEQQH